MLSLSQKLTWEVLLSLTISLMSAVLILALTLNLMAAAIVVVFAISAMIFQRSFSWGWLFLLAILLIFPALRVGSGNIYINDLLLASLSLIGLISLATGKFNLPDNQLSSKIFLLLILGILFMAAGFSLKQEINQDILEACMTFVFIWISILTFQYYFQTDKRIYRFFSVIFFIAILHSFFGLLMLCGNWQTSSGMGIANDKNTHLIFSQTEYQVNGFLGIGLEKRLKSSGLAQILMMSIPVSLGLYLIDREEKKGLLASEAQAHWKKYLRRKKTARDWRRYLVALKKSSINYLKQLDKKQSTILALIAVQALALIFTYSYSSLVFLSLGILVLGILDRNKRIIYSATAFLFLFSMVFPWLNAPAGQQSSEGFAQWFEGADLLLKNWFLGNGWRVYSQEAGLVAQKISNSYLFIWNNFGLAGLFIFIAMLVEYFYTLYQGYRKSDGQKRIWLMVIIAIFIEFVFEAMTNNTLIYGPAAVIFWLLYGAVMNLKKKDVIFGLTETRLGEQNG